MTNDGLAGEAWNHFCDELKRAGQALLRDTTPKDELTLAEGYRHLVRLIRAGFEITGEFADTLHPEIFAMASATLLSEGVTRDARYHQAFIDGAATHRVFGQRGTAPLIEFGVYTGRTGVHPTSELVGCLTEADLVIADDGSFEVVLGPDEPPGHSENAGNWIRTDAETKYLFIRQYAHDWLQTESANCEIRREGVDGVRPPLSLDALRAGLAGTAAFVNYVPPFWAAISDYWADYAVNEIVPQQSADEKTDITVPSGHRFACGYFRLEPDEALVVVFAPTEVPYWGLGLVNYWYETLAWREGGAQINNRTVAYEADGSVRAVISERDPGVPNWLATTGHLQGTMVFRWSRSDDPLPTFETELVKVDALASGAS